MRTHNWVDRYNRFAPSYKCAGGCGGTVDRPFEQCLACTMEWLHVGKIEPEHCDEPKDAA